MDFLLKRGKQHYWELFRSKKPYFSRKGEGDILQFVENFKKDYEETNGKGLICIPSGNHDISRITEELDSEEIKIAFAFILTMPGAPFIYYGDEIGMKNMAGLDSIEGSEERTQSRTPMQWNKKVNGGFSTAGAEKLYAPMDPDRNCPDVETQMAKDGSLWKDVQSLIRIRQDHKALQSKAPVRFVYAEQNSYPFVYVRECEEERILIVLNPKEEAISCELSEEFEILEMIYSNHGVAKLTKKTLSVPGASATFFRLS